MARQEVTCKCGAAFSVPRRSGRRRKFCPDCRPSPGQPREPRPPRKSAHQLYLDWKRKHEALGLTGEWILCPLRDPVLREQWVDRRIARKQQVWTDPKESHRHCCALLTRMLPRELRRKFASRRRPPDPRGFQRKMITTYKLSIRRGPAPF